MSRMATTLRLHWDGILLMTVFSPAFLDADITGCYSMDDD
jgi:hypothetical protein